MKTAMILAAGRGARLKPLTNNYPKALCVVRDKPLIEHHIINLAQAGFEHIVINHAYLGGYIRHYLGTGKPWGVIISYSPEPPGGLETGGGINNALPLLGTSPFLTINADIYTDFNFAALNLTTVAHMHLILVNKNPLLHHCGDFGISDNNLLVDNSTDYTFAGIACYHPKVFDNLSLGRYSITPILRSYAKANKATAAVHHGTWFDIGSLERLQAANHL